MVTAVLAGALLPIDIAAAPFILLARTLPSASDLLPAANARFNGQLGHWNAVWALLGRPRLVAELVFRLAQGANPSNLAKTLPRELLRDEEGFAPRDPDV
jgi:hypothetical protein